MHIDDIEIEDDRVLHMGSPNVVVRARVGLLCLNRFSPIGRSVCFYGEHANNELEFCRKFISVGDVVFDVGAHQGTHTVTFAQMVGRVGSVYAFEPQRLMYQNACASVALNGLTNVTVENVAVGAADGAVRIVDFDYSKPGHFSGMKIKEENSGELVKLIALDDYARRKNLLRVDFLKIDVEGFEVEVLRGAKDLIDACRPTIYCEFHPGSEALASLLIELGYRMFIHAPPGFNRENFFGYPEDRFRGSVDHNALCVHQSVFEKYCSLLKTLDEFHGGD